MDATEDDEGSGHEGGGVSMSDVQSQVESTIAEFDNGWIGPKRAKALAAALAEAGLLADQYAAYDLENAREAGKSFKRLYDTARAELTEVNQRAIEMEGRYRGAKLRAERAETELERISVVLYSNSDVENSGDMALDLCYYKAGVEGSIAGLTARIKRLEAVDDE